MTRSSLAGYQAQIRDLLLADAPPENLSSLGDRPARWHRYRHMVRARFYEVIDHAFARLVSVIGREEMHRRVDRFLREAPPRSPYLREVPGEFLRFAEGFLLQSEPGSDLPPFTSDLLRFEWAERETAYAAPIVPPSSVVDLSMDRPAVLSPARRLLELGFAVHRIGTDGDTSEAVPGSFLLLVYRDPRTHEVETLELTASAWLLLTEMEKPHGTLTEVVRNAATRAGAEVDVPFVEALSALLADLAERGVLLGSLAD